MKEFTTMLMAGILTIGGAATVYATTTYKTATLNHAKMRFDEGEVQTVQCYNIDGYNYVRARDITNKMNLSVQAIQNGTAGVMIDPHTAPTSKTAAEKLTQQTARVKVEKGELIYDGSVTEAECFLLNDRYYFKLADFGTASAYAEQGATELVDIEAKAGIAEKPFMPVFYGIEINWNEAEKVVDISSKKVDLQQMFDAARKEEMASDSSSLSNAQTDVGAEEKTESKKPSDFTVQPPLTKAPKEGTFLANILIDDKARAYTDTAMTQVNGKNYTTPYAYADAGAIGQCTWYARGRLVETTGLDAVNNRFVGAGVNHWVEKAQSASCPDVDGITDPYGIRPRSIAVWDGHAAFVEWVDYDADGDPVTVYFTEANANHRNTGRLPGVYYPDFDGMVKKMSFKDFIDRNEFIGYVVMTKDTK